MSEDLEVAVREFLDAADDVFGEYENGYMNADVALDQLGVHVEELSDAVEE